MYYALVAIFIIVLFLLLRAKKSKPTEKLTFIDLNEHNGKLFNDLANDNIKFGNSDKAIYYFTKAIELKPELSEYYLNRGNLYWDLGISSLALIDWRTAENLGSTTATELLNKNKPIHQAKAEKITEFETLLNDFGIDYLYHMTQQKKTKPDESVYQEKTIDWIIVLLIVGNILLIWVFLNLDKVLPILLNILGVPKWFME